MTTGPIDFARKFHRDRRGQIMPLIFFLGIAFFTGVVLVINTGRAVTGRIQAQNAVDAASVSGANTIARGMNYIASNNISMAKLLASIVILRAFPGAIDDSRLTLDIWKVVAQVMIHLGEVLAAIPFTAAAGAALQVAGHFIYDVKIPQEEEVLDLVEEVVDPLIDLWDDDGNGIAWIILKALAKLGDILAYASPVIAQFTAKAVYKANIAPGESGDAWMLPLYPKMPSCKGKFKDFVDKVTHYAEKWSEPITIAGWLVLTLSLFPIHYMNHLKSEIRELFTGEGSSTSSTDPDTAELQRLNDEIEERQEEISDLNTQLNQYDAQIASVADGDSVLEQPFPGLGSHVPTLQSQRNQIQLRIDVLEAEINDRQDQMTDITDRRTQSGGGQPDDFSNDIDDPLGGGEVQDNEDIYPYMIDGSDWPKSFTYFCLGTRSLGAPMTDRVFKKPMETAYVYAAARVVNSVAADLWTPAWHARLVRAQASLIPSNPIGTLPSACGMEGESGGSEVPEGDAGAPDGDNQSGILQSLLGLLSKH